MDNRLGSEETAAFSYLHCLAQPRKRLSPALFPQRCPIEKKRDAKNHISMKVNHAAIADCNEHNRSKERFQLENTVI
jgi:hypothetical protein